MRGREGTEEPGSEELENEADAVLEGGVGALVEVLGELDEGLVEAVESALGGAGEVEHAA